MDDKLKEILERTPADSQLYIKRIDKTIAEIKQCFLDEGYITPDATIANSLAYKGRVFMTGAEFYDRFEKELEATGNCEIHTCSDVPYVCTCDLLDAVERAAGLEDSK